MAQIITCHRVLLSYISNNASISFIPCTSAQHKYTELCFFPVRRCCFSGNHLCCVSPKQSCPLVGWRQHEKFRARFIFSRPSNRIFTHSRYCISGFHHFCPFWCTSQLLNLFTTVASPSPEADDQKYQKFPANEESPAATCRTKPTITALPANSVAESVEWRTTKTAWWECCRIRAIKGCQAPLEFTQPSRAPAPAGPSGSGRRSNLGGTSSCADHQWPHFAARLPITRSSQQNSVWGNERGNRDM